MNLKFIAYNTNILISNGKPKKIQDVLPDDILCGEDNFEVEILNIETQTCENDMCNFIVIPKMGKNFYLHGLHNIPVFYNGNKTLVNINELYNFHNKEKNIYLYTHCYNFVSNDELFMDPYFLGIWLCQNINMNQNDIPKDLVRIYTNTAFIQEFTEKIISKFEIKHKSTNDYIDIFDTKFVSIFSYYNLIENMHIPLVYKKSNPKVRIHILSAFCDVLGSVENEKDCFSFDKIENTTIHNDFCFILNSLGFFTSTSKGKIKIFSPTISSIPSLSNKCENIDQTNFTFENNYFQVAPIQDDKYCILQLQRNVNILTDDFTVI